MFCIWLGEGPILDSSLCLVLNGGSPADTKGTLVGCPIGGTDCVNWGGGPKLVCCLLYIGKDEGPERTAVLEDSGPGICGNIPRGPYNSFSTNRTVSSDCLKNV